MAPPWGSKSWGSTALVLKRLWARGALFGLFVACANAVPSRLSETVQSTVDGGEICLSSAIGGAWEALALFGPYTSAGEVGEALGFEWPEFSRTGLEQSDTFSLVVLVSSGAVQESLRVPRCSPDFGDGIQGRLWAREASCFRLHRGTGCATLDNGG